MPNNKRSRTQSNAKDTAEATAVHRPVLTEFYTNWTCEEGLREYVQNWYDVARTAGHNTFELIFKSSGNKNFIFAVARAPAGEKGKDRVLAVLQWQPTAPQQTCTLTLVNLNDRMVGTDLWDLGVSSKAEGGSETVGYKGEGGKIGAIALLRTPGVRLNLYSCGLHTAVFFEDVPGRDYRGLAVHTQDSPVEPLRVVPAIGCDPRKLPKDWIPLCHEHTVKIIDGLPSEALEKCFRDILPIRFVMEPSVVERKVVRGVGEILFHTTFQGHIFVCGFRVGLGRDTIGSHLRYGYNFSDNGLCEDRDRRTIDGDMLRHRIYHLWRDACNELDTTQRLYDLHCAPSSELVEEVFIMQDFNVHLNVNDRCSPLIQMMVTCFVRANQQQAPATADSRLVKKEPYPVAERDEKEKQHALDLGLLPVECGHSLLRLLRMGRERHLQELGWSLL